MSSTSTAARGALEQLEIYRNREHILSDQLSAEMRASTRSLRSLAELPAALALQLLPMPRPLRFASTKGRMQSKGLGASILSCSFFHWMFWAQHIGLGGVQTRVKVMETLRWHETNDHKKINLSGIAIALLSHSPLAGLRWLSPFFICLWRSPLLERNLCRTEEKAIEAD